MSLVAPVPTEGSTATGNAGNAGNAGNGGGGSVGINNSMSSGMYQSQGFENLTSPGLMDEKNVDIFTSPKMVNADELHSSMSAVRAVIPVPTYSNFNQNQHERAPEKRRTVDLLKWVMN